MSKKLFPLILLLFAPFMKPAGGDAADIGAPVLSPPLQIAGPFEAASALRTGIRLEQSRDVVFEPQLGVSHARREREIRSGYDEVTHTIHAQAGGSISLFQIVSLSAAAKFPVYSVESSDRWIAGAAFSQSGPSRHGYDILRTTENLSWTGEMGVRLTDELDFNLFYDQDRRFDHYSGNGGSTRQEDRFGTRLIFRFR